MKTPLQFAVWILLVLGSQASAQEVTGRFYPEKQHYLVGEPIFVVLELTNVSSRVITLDDGHCNTRFEPQMAWRQLMPNAPAVGVGGSCGSTIAPWAPGLTVTRRFLLDAPFRLNSPGIYPMRAHHTVHVNAFGEGGPVKLEEIVTDFDVSLGSANEDKGFQDRSQQNFELNLPTGIQSELVQIDYFLTGPFGGYGMFVRPESGKHKSLIPTTVDGKAANALKAVVYVPGCRIAKISVSSLLDSTRKADFTCHTNKSLAFRGSIQQPQSLGGHDYSVEINLIAQWAMEFFGYTDGIVPSFHITSLAVKDGSSFSGRIPDFTQEGDATLQVVAREKNTGNNLGFLQPTEKKYDQFGNLRLLRNYPDEITFHVSDKPASRH